METNEKTFRHSFIKVALMFLGVLFLGFVAFLDNQINYFLFGVMGVVLLVALFYASSSVKISNEEITTTRLLSSKSFRWSDIGRVSTRGQALRLHNYDDLTLSLDPQLDGYTEILDIIFRKRPDLFDSYENTVMSSSWLGNLFALGTGLLFMGVPVFLFFVTEEFDQYFSLIAFAIGGVVLAGWFLSPKRLTLEGKNLILGYLFKEVSYSADDINSISLQRQRTRNGYIYFVQANLKSGKRIRLPAFQQGAPLMYQILKRWHEKAASRFA